MIPSIMQDQQKYLLQYNIILILKKRQLVSLSLYFVFLFLIEELQLAGEATSSIVNNNNNIKNYSVILQEQKRRKEDRERERKKEQKGNQPEMRNYVP